MMSTNWQDPDEPTVDPLHEIIALEREDAERRKWVTPCERLMGDMILTELFCSSCGTFRMQMNARTGDCWCRGCDKQSFVADPVTFPLPEIIVDDETTRLRRYVRKVEQERDALRGRLRGACFVLLTVASVAGWWLLWIMWRVQ
jgi:hypothetical protein